MKKSELLQRGLQYLKCPENAGIPEARHSFICTALATAARNATALQRSNSPRMLNDSTVGVSVGKSLADLQKIISRRMDGKTNIGSWLEYKGLYPSYKNERELRESLDRIQSFRYAWMQELLREFKAAGE